MSRGRRATVPRHDPIKESTLESTLDQVQDFLGIISGIYIAELKEQGVISDSEFQQMKQNLLKRM